MIGSLGMSNYYQTRYDNTNRSRIDVSKWESAFAGKVDNSIVNNGRVQEPIRRNVVDAYRAAANSSINNVKQVYSTHESENYKIVPDNEAGCFDIYDKDGVHLGAFAYSDIKIKRDSETGKELLISEHGSMSYDALVLDNELKESLQSVMGKESLDIEELRGFELKTHSGTGIQFLVKEGEEGRGGKVFLQSEADREQYEKLAELYYNKYANLISDKNAGYIWADLEIKGLAERTESGIISMGFNGMSYNDNADYKKDWSVLFSEGTYKSIYKWLQKNRSSIQALQKFATWQNILDNIGTRYERVWSKEEEEQGFLNN